VARDAIYLDNLASTPLDPRVRAAMLPWLAPERAGNPHAAHRAGRSAAAAVEAAADDVACLLGVRPSEIVFTSGATEANHLALLGLRGGVRTVAVSAIEHASVLGSLERLTAAGLRCHILPVDARGYVQPGALTAPLAEGPALVSVIAASNEIGTRQDLATIADMVHAAGGLLHTDAAQAVGRVPVDAGRLGIDAATISAHKLYGPMGVGALYARAGLSLAAEFRGGGQQGGRRSGTVPVALAVGLGRACRIICAERETEALRLDGLARRFWDAVRAAWPEAQLNGVPFALPGCLSVTLPGVDAADLLLDVPDLMLSTGSACESEQQRPSHVLSAIGLDPCAAQATLRISLGRFTTAVEVERATAQLATALRARRPIGALQ
jgi:cysteine desulfurase